MEITVLIYIFLIFLILSGFIFFMFFKKNKKKDEEIFNINFSYEKSNKSYIKDIDKEFILLNIDKFEKFIGNGKVFYLQSFLSKKNKFNGGAFLGGFLWLGYRGLIWEYFTFLGLYTLIDIVTLYFQIPLTFPPNILGIVTSLVLGTIGNYLYFLKIKNAIKKDKKKLNPLLGIIIVVISFGIYLYFIDFLYTYSITTKF